MLTHDIQNDIISCSCRLFEFAGYVFRHILALMRVNKYMLFPNKYILPRWKKKEKKKLNVLRSSRLYLISTKAIV